MLTLNRTAFSLRHAWEKAQVRLPSFDWEAVAEKTKREPRWVHFGAGNIFRGYIARLQQDLLEKGLADTGIITVESYDEEIIDRIYVPYDHVCLLVTLLRDGNVRRELIASVTEALSVSQSRSRLKELFRSPSLQMVSFTITEKGYALTNIEGGLLPVVQHDMEHPPDQAQHVMGLLAALLLERFAAGGMPLALVSMDNCSHNGEKLRSALLRIAQAWREREYVSGAFLSWLADENSVSFPWSMIDKITPRPSEEIGAQLERDGIRSMAAIRTTRGTCIAPFVNAEKTEYLVIEDKFPNGRPPLESAGVYFTDRDTVNAAERMKVTTCLNPLHTALAVTGCLLGYKSIAAEMRDPLLKTLVERIGLTEGMPACTHPRIIEPSAFLREVLEERLPNPFIPDTPQRIATDTSQKVAIRFGETIKAYVSSEQLDPACLTGIPLAIAAWFRYLLGVDDLLRPMNISDDPLMNELREGLSGVRSGDPNSYTGQLTLFLRRESLFGVDVCASGLGTRIEHYFVEMLNGAGAVRRTLERHLYTAS